MITMWAPDGVPEIAAGTDLTAVITDAFADLQTGDIISVTSKIVSKAQGQLRTAQDREQAITEQTVRVVATRARPDGHPLRIVENRLGLVMAAAGVDASNTLDGTILLLPEDPDATAREIRTEILARTGANVAIIITDTSGRPWRAGLTDMAIGCAGIDPLDDLRGQSDTAGKQLNVTVTAVADELAAATELVKGKTAGKPLAAVRGMAHLVLAPGEHGPGARALVRLGDQDLFSEGAAEAYARGVRDGKILGSQQ